jgi:predicted HAD superfamily Cof-like phosphohydrolase
MHNDVFSNVLRFHAKLCPDQFREIPGWPTKEILDLRVDLLQEEFEEIILAVQERNLVKLADGLADLEYVLNGFAIACGFYMPLINGMVQEANMKKYGGPTRADGKILKPEGWTSPDIAWALHNQPKLVLPVENKQQGTFQCTASINAKQCEHELGHVGPHLAEGLEFGIDIGEGWEG